MRTPSQTVGPFFGYALPFEAGPRLVPPWRTDTISLHGSVYDGAGEPIPDALVEIWQPDAAGAMPSASGHRARDPHGFTGFGRCGTDAAGHYRFHTLAPGGAHGHASMAVFARGLLHHLYTRVYLPGTPIEPALAAQLSAERAATLVAAAEPGGFRFDVHLQGEHETVFLEFG